MERKNLRNQSGCWDCQHCYVWSQQDEDTRWICNIKGVMPRNTDEADAKEIKALLSEWGRMMQEWWDWMNDNEVRPYQICDNWNE